MGIFLNSTSPYKKYQAVVTDTYFVDKTALIEELIPSLGKEKRFFCITRPRRFGKTVMANMTASFFGKGVDSSPLFDKLKIAQSKHYREHLNQHRVIYIDFSEIPRRCQDYQQYILRIEEGIIRDLTEAYPEMEISKEEAVWDILTRIFEKTGHTFIFVMDEWDAVFHMPFIIDAAQKQYLLFLKALLKSKAYVELAYMTGILPIAKYSGGSELNMFLEYNIATKKRFSEYFGFLDREVDALFDIYRKKTKEPRITREGLRFWYDGYYTVTGERLYNPRSVVYALADDQLSGYWTDSGPYDEIYYYIKGNVADVRDDLAWMVSGERVEAKMQQYAATAKELKTKDQIYSAMVVYGLLTYKDGEVMIPNKELMDKFDELLLTNETLGYVHNLAKHSSRMLKATLAGDVKTMAHILKYAHDTESPLLSYNHETELSAVVNLVYLFARDRYRVEREDKAGEGFVDFIFYPVRRNEDCMILELKVDASPKEAVRQIRDKRYALRFKGKLGEELRYTGRILAVGIGYDKKTKEHACEVEVLEDERKPAIMKND